ncbi:hypothetical protein FALBO_3254 [Fusarium albosuccineum]|uniref:Apple domain-containing protein n=1 Tax=Fusarium albosuccineum TaxID=1237068 RepID=A0A8H4PBT8_9HYPO|nr:hypothetical protein FALBO_3254 [Fusarium albosuccineum]
MPSVKVFAAVLAAMALPIASAGPCKPKTSTTLGSTTSGTETGTETSATTGTTDISVSTTATGTDTETGTQTTTTDASSTTEACAYYTPISPVPVTCGQAGHALDCLNKIINTDVKVTTSADCGNLCGRTAGCVSFSFKPVPQGSDSQCTLYSASLNDINFMPNADLPVVENFYNLEDCFTCGHETSTTETGASSTETGTTTGSTETETGSTTTGTETGSTSTETGTTSETASSTETGSTSTETGSTSTETGTTTTETGFTTETTTTAATTTTTEACTSYTPVVEPPASCGKHGTIDPLDGETHKQGFSIGAIDAADCGNKCGNDGGCKSFAFEASSVTGDLGSCQFYDLPLSELNFQESEISLMQFYDLYDCFSCAEGSSTTTTTGTESSTETTTATAESTTTTGTTETTAATSSETSATSTETSATSTETTTATSTETTTATSTETTASSTETSASSTETTTTMTSTTETYSTTTEVSTTTEASTTTTTTEAATTTSAAVCATYTPAFDQCSYNTVCGVRGEICKETKIPDAGDNSCLEACAKSCIEYGAECKYFMFQKRRPNKEAKCILYSKGEVKENAYSWQFFYEPECFKCKEPKEIKKTKKVEKKLKKIEKKLKQIY